MSNKTNHPHLLVEYAGESISLRELSRRVGIGQATLCRRYHNGRRMPELIAPVDESRRHKGNWGGL